MASLNHENIQPSYQFPGLCSLMLIKHGGTECKGNRPPSKMCLKSRGWVNYDQVFPDKDVFFSKTPRRTYFHTRTETNKESLWKCLGLPQQSNNISISFRESIRKPISEDGFCFRFRNDNGLPVHIYEWVNERMIQTSCFFVEQSLSQASDWYKEGFQLEKIFRFLFFKQNMNFIHMMWISWISSCFFCIFFIRHFNQRHEKPHNKNVLGFVTCMTQWLNDL